jgi:hypothetical protein
MVLTTEGNVKKTAYECGRSSRVGGVSLRLFHFRNPADECLPKAFGGEGWLK